jgi:hypothetical protein
METTKTLWLLDYGNQYLDKLVPIYAETEEDAWFEAALWAIKHNITLPDTAVLIHPPHGFTIHTRNFADRKR